MKEPGIGPITSKLKWNVVLSTLGKWSPLHNLKPWGNRAVQQRCAAMKINTLGMS
jgi:hypothetical protein